jgi:protocatechuate 3,4-dioxygenase beta subunit
MSQQTARTSAAALLDDVVSAYTRTDDPRWNEVIGALVRHLHAFANEVHLMPQEWLAAIEFLTQTGKTSVGPRQEFILLSDALGFSSAVDNLNSASSQHATQSALLGPFYVPQSPPIADGESIALSGAGESVLIRGRVLDTRGRPIANAQLDIWHTAPNGLYAVQDSAQPEMNFRGKLRTRADGGFTFRTLKPVAYPVPTDGPVGRLLARSGRHPMRPAHIHFIVGADGFAAVTTQLFTRDDPYIDSDAVFGVKPSLLVDYRRNEDPALDAVWLLEYDFVLARAPEVGAGAERERADR